MIHTIWFQQTIVEKLDIYMEKYTLISNLHHTKINLKLIKDLNLETNIIKLLTKFYNIFITLG